MEDGDFLLSLQQGMLSCLQRGARICHIVPSLYSGDQLLECLMRWVPLYLTGGLRRTTTPISATGSIGTPSPWRPAG